MKRIHYDGQSMVTGSEVATALATYAESVARMGASSTVQIPVLEENGSVLTHSLLLTAATALETFDIDGEPTDESERFPVPKFAPIGGAAAAITTDEIDSISIPIE